MLALIVRLRSGTWTMLRGGEVIGPLSLSSYAIPFSFAYRRIGAATGALVLFGVVQLTMVGYGMVRGQRPAIGEWMGLALATVGLVALTLPSATRPDPLGLLLMAAAGVAWGVYSLVGRESGEPVAANARSFLWSLPLAILANLALRASIAATPKGIALAIFCGAVTSGLGYVIWYAALPLLTVTQAAAAQLGVPVIASLGAILVLDEMLSARLVTSGAAILTGIGIALATRAPSSGE